LRLYSTIAKSKLLDDDGIGNEGSLDANHLVKQNSAMLEKKVQLVDVDDELSTELALDAPKRDFRAIGGQSVPHDLDRAANYVLGGSVPEWWHIRSYRY